MFRDSRGLVDSAVHIYNGLGNSVAMSNSQLQIMAHAVDTTSDFVLGDLVFEKVGKSKAGFVERQMIPCVNNERRPDRSQHFATTPAKKKIKHVSVGIAEPRSIHQDISDCLGQFWRTWVAASRQGPTVELQVRFALEKKAPTMLSSTLYAYFVRECAERTTQWFSISVGSVPSSRTGLRPVSHATKCRCWIPNYLCHSRLSSPHLLPCFTLCWTDSLVPDALAVRKGSSPGRLVKCSVPFSQKWTRVAKVTFSSLSPVLLGTCRSAECNFSAPKPLSTWSQKVFAQNT